MKLISTVAVLILLNSCCAFRSHRHEPVAVAAAPASAPSEVEYKVIPLRYAAANDIANALRGTLSGQPGRNPPRIVPDDRTNSVIISCAPDELTVIEKLIAELDVEVKKSK